MSERLMRAVVYHGAGDVRVEQIAVPVCEEGGLLVKVDACAVCGVGHEGVQVRQSAHETADHDGA